MAYPQIEKAGKWDTVNTTWTDGPDDGNPIKTEYKITCAWGCGCCITVEELTRQRLIEHIEQLEESLTEARLLLASLFVSEAKA